MALRRPGGKRKRKKGTRRDPGRRELPTDPFIVKVQAAIRANVENPPVLVHNKDRSIQLHLPFDAFFESRLNHREKAYFLAKLHKQKIIIGQEVPAPDW